MKTLLLASFILILSCSRESNNSEMGVLTISLASKNNNFIYFDFVIENIYLIASNGNRININEGVDKNINISELTNKSEIILSINVPENTYYDVAIDINLNKSTIKDAGAGIAGTPNLYDIYALNIKENESIYRIESNIDAGFPLTVRKDKPSHLSFEFDIDASTRWLATDNDGVNDLLISPAFNVSSLIAYPENIHLTGIFKSFKGEKLLVTPLKFHDINQTPVEITASKHTIYSSNNETRNLEEWKADLVNSKNGIIIFSGNQKNNQLEARSLSYFNNSTLHKIEGVITERHVLVGSLEMLSKEKSTIEFLEKEMMNVAPGATVKTSSVTKNIQTHTDNNSYLIGTIKQTTNSAAELIPLGINALPSSIFFGENKVINVYYNDGFLSNDDLVSFSGNFNENGEFFANNFEFIDKKKHRLHLASSLLSMEDIVTSATKDGLDINQDNASEILSYIKLSGLPIREDKEYSINKISFAYTPEKLVIITNRTQPSHDIYQLFNVNNFIEELNQRRSQDYIINSIVADGRLNDDNFIASSLVVSLLPSEKTNVRSNLLKGKAPLPLLLGPFLKPKLKLSDLSNYIKNNIQTFKKPFPRQTAHTPTPRKKITLEDIKIGGKGDISTLNVSEQRKAADFQRTFFTYNHDLGGYFSSRINQLNTSPDSLIKNFKQIEEIKPLKPLFNKSDKVVELKQIYILNQYLSDIRDNELSRASKSIYHEYLAHPKNASLLNVLLTETPQEFRRKSHEIDLNDVILRNDKTRTLEKLLINDTDAYKKIFDTYEKYLVKHYADESLTNKYLWGAEKGDKGQFLSKIEKLFKDGGSLELDEEFTKINKIITDHIEQQSVTDQQSQKTALKLEDAFKSASLNTSEKKFASLINVESGSSSNDIAKLRYALTGIKPETTIKPKILVDIPTMKNIQINIDINNLPKPTINTPHTKIRR